MNLVDGAFLLALTASTISAAFTAPSTLASPIINSLVYRKEFQ
jgi:hypothetical protein